MLTPAARAARIACDAGVVVGAVAEVLEDVRAVGEGRLADPVGALAAHVGEALGVAVHPAGPCSGSRCRHRRGRPRAGGSRCCAGSRSRTRACGRRSPRRCRRARRRRGAARRAVERLGLDAVEGEERAEGAGDLHRVERLLDREDRLARLVLPAGDAAAAAVVEDRLLDLHLDELALLLDDDDVLEVVRPLAEARHVERPDHADLVGGDPEPLGLGGVDAEEVERVRGVEPGLARRRRCRSSRRASPQDAAVDSVGAGKGFGGEALVVVEPRLLRHGGVVAADVEAVLGHGEVRWA